MSFSRARPPGMWPIGGIVPPLVWNHLDDYSDAVDGLHGGAYAPDNPLIFGGAGVWLGGTGNQVLANGRLDVMPGAELRLPDTASTSVIPVIAARGTGGAIRLYVSGHTSIFEVASGATSRILAGGSIDVFGSLTLKKVNGPGTMTVEDTCGVTFESGAFLALASGSTANVSGTMHVYGTLRSHSASTVQLDVGTTVDVHANASVDGDLTLTGDTTFGADKWPLLSPDRAWERRSMSIALVTYLSGSAPGDPDAWAELSNISTGPCLRTTVRTTSGAYSIVEFLDLPSGASLSEMTIDTNGVDATIPTYPQYQIVRWKGDSYSTLSALVTDEHSSTGDWGSNSQVTSVPVSSAHTIDRSYRYGLKVIFPFAATGSAMRIFECVAVGSAASMRI